MGFKKFILKKTLQFKGVDGEQAERIAEELDKNPELVGAMKKLEGNTAVMELFKKIQAEIEEKKKGGMPEQYAMMAAMTKYKGDIAEHKDELLPLMQLFGGMQ